MAAYRFNRYLPGEKQAMEMTEYGKHGKPRIRLSILPTLFGNPFGITTFPRPRLLAYFEVQQQERPNPRPLDLEGVVMEVLGPKCNNAETKTLVSITTRIIVRGAGRAPAVLRQFPRRSLPS